MFTRIAMMIRLMEIKPEQTQCNELEQTDKDYTNINDSFYAPAN